MYNENFSGKGSIFTLTPEQIDGVNDVPNKQDKVIPSTVGNIQTFDAQGNSADSGKLFNDGGATGNDVLSAQQVDTRIATARVNDKGWFADLTALQTAHPVGQDGWFAILGSTDSLWVWDSNTNSWKETDSKGQVSSVFSRTGVIVPVSGDYNAEQITYDNTTSNLEATTSQQAIDELNEVLENASSRNYLDNGDFQVWQKGTTLTGIPNGEMIADRWVASGATFDASQMIGGDEAWGRRRPYFHVESATGLSGGVIYRVPDVTKFINKGIIVSYWAKTADPATGDIYRLRFSVYVTDGASNDFAGDITMTIGSTIDGTWKKFFKKFEIIDSTVANLNLADETGMILLQFQKLDSQGFDLDIANVKLEISENESELPTVFIPKPYNEELRNCQYFFERLQASTSFGLLSSGFHSSNTEFRGLLSYAEKRAVPTITFSDLSHFTVDNSGTNSDATNLSFSEVGTNRSRIVLTHVDQGNADSPGILGFKDLAGYIDIDSTV